VKRQINGRKGKFGGVIKRFIVPFDIVKSRMREKQEEFCRNRMWCNSHRVMNKSVHDVIWHRETTPKRKLCSSSLESETKVLPAQTERLHKINA